LTRRVNILADKALLASFAAGSHQVGAKEARAAIKDADFSDSRPVKTGHSLPPGLFWAAGGALAMLTLTGVWRLVAPTATEAVVATPTQAAPAASQPVQASAPPALPASTPPAETTPPPAAPTPAPIELATVAPVVSANTTPTLLLDKLLMESRPWIDSVAENRWFLQLYTTVDSEHPDRVEAFLRQAQNSGADATQLRVYYSKLGDMSRYGVVYGDYASRKDAVKGLDTLPADLKRYRPYARQAIRLRPDSNTRNKK
jgi:septal ring-binding cell division protein DamX